MKEKKTQKINFMRNSNIETFKKRLIESTKNKELSEKINPGQLTIKGKKHWTL